MAGRPRRAAAIAAVQRIWNAGDVADDGGLSDLDDGSNNVVHILVADNQVKNRPRLPALPYGFSTLASKKCYPKFIWSC